MSTGRRRQVSSEAGGPDSRTRIDAAAERLFAGRGYAATSMADVAGEAGVSNGSLFHHYPTKVDLAVACWTRAYRARLELTSQPVLNERTHERVVRAIVVGHAASIESDRTAAMLLMVQEPPGIVVERTDAVLAAERTAFEQLVTAWLRRGHADGELRRLTFDSARALIIGPGTDLGRRWLLGRTATSPRSVANVLADGAWAAVSRRATSRG